jgi:phosphocarrier protein
MQQRALVRLVNARGLHARPCHAIASAALRFKSSLHITHGGQKVDAKSILDLLTLCAAPGAELELIAEGEDADEMLRCVVELVGQRFGESD